MEVFGTPGWRWYNEPSEWSTDNGLTVSTDQDTDFWRTTHYGFTRDTGHLLGRDVTGDFVLRASFTGTYVDQYDQAGIALRVDHRNWIKAGIEFVDGRRLLSVVVTRDYSDWSVATAPPGRVDIEASRTGDTVTVRTGETLLRLAYFPPAIPVLAGVMCASPDGGGFPVTFHNARIAQTDV